jgi:hypothetical protein
MMVQILIIEEQESLKTMLKLHQQILLNDHQILPCYPSLIQVNYDYD